MAIRRVITQWFARYFSQDEAVVLSVLLILGFALVMLLGKPLAPFLTALVVAFLLQGGVSRLEHWRVPRLWAISLMFLSFLGIFLGLLLFVLPLVWDQLVTLLQESPRMFAQAQVLLDELQQRYPSVVTHEQIQGWIGTAGSELTALAQRAVRLSLTSLGNIIAFGTFLVLVPILVFFMLKDKDLLVGFFLSVLPRKRTLMARVWKEVDEQIANYVRGKVIEIVIVAAVSYATFYILGLPFAMLLGLVVGLSVLIPFIGAAVATLPVAAVAGFSFGLGDQFLYAILAYTIIQILDGNVLSPLLFSGAVNLHPVAIILAILFFGGTLGFWGIFFAIPLATLFKALWSAWPRDAVVLSDNNTSEKSP